MDSHCGCKKACGVDRLVNGYFIVPPTPGYREDPDHPLEPGGIASIPQEVLTLAHKSERTTTDRATVDDDGDWFAEAIRGPVHHGQRNDTATRLAGLFLAKGVKADHVVATLEIWARTACVPPMDLNELRETVKSIAKSEAAKKNGGAAGPVVVRLADVTPESVSWLWPGRLARGKLALCIGDPGLGKSFLTLDVAARISTGRPWPDGTPAPCGDVVLLTAEDGLADTVRPRLDAMGGDPSRVHVLKAIRTGDRERGVDLTRDLPHLEALIVQTKAILVIVDPVSAYLGNTDSYRDAEVRGVLAPIAALAERTGVAVEGIMHLTKNQQRQAIHRAQGNIAFVGAARAVFAVAEDRENPERRLFLPVKMNIARKPAGLAFRLVASEDVARLEWESEPVDVDVEDALAGPEPPEEKSERQNATDFLLKVLAEGSVKVSEVDRLAREAGISDRTLERARGKLGVKAIRVGGMGHDGWWELSLRTPNPPKSATDSLGENMAVLGESGGLRKPEPPREAPAEVEL
jgi:hypothetical protein